MASPRGRRSSPRHRCGNRSRFRPLAPHPGATLSTISDGSARILYLSHNGLTEPLGRRQILPYLVGLSARGWRFSVISFEKAQTASPEAMARVQEIATASGIGWRPLDYHRQPPVLSTGLDVLRGWIQGKRLGRGVRLIHARSTVPALMARMVSESLRVPWVFDLRGLLAEEYADAGLWTRRGIRYQITSRAERGLIASADGLVTLTRRVQARLPLPDPSRHARPAAVIPCSTDLSLFQPSEATRRDLRKELGWGDEPVLVYSGSLGSWYRLGEMLDFYEVARTQIPGLRFLVLTPQVPVALRELRSRRLDREVVAKVVAPDDVPRHLAGADAGICFLGRHPSKDASSPTKYGEYLAAGLPVVTNSWIGDAQDLESERPWLLVDVFSRDAYQRTALRLAELLADPKATRLAARELAGREFALETATARYHDLYLRVLGR